MPPKKLSASEKKRRQAKQSKNWEANIVHIRIRKETLGIFRTFKSRSTETDDHLLRRLVDEYSQR